MSKPILFMMFGYPGAGKSTTAKLIQELTDAEHLSSDNTRLQLFPKPKYTQEEHDTVYNTLDERAETFLRSGKNVIYDGNLNRFKHRLEKYELCERTGARPVLLWLQTPREVAHDRAILRGHDHLVPHNETFNSMFNRVADAMEDPREDEPVYVLKGARVDRRKLAEIISRL